MDIIYELPTDGFPERISISPHPPKQLYFRGVLPDFSSLRFVTIVGARTPSEYGRIATELLVRELSPYPVCIVSGLAVGIDGIAHETALAVGLPTLAIPGSGVFQDVIYPASHRPLAERVIASGGCIMSEFAPLFRASSWSFPVRNRLMASIADIVIVIEAEANSGSMITANLALDYNRIVGAVPGSILSPLSYGTNKLISSGALLVASGADIAGALNLKTPDSLSLFDL